MNIALPLPQLHEQERIVRILDETETLRRLRAESDHRIAEVPSSLFNEMFGDPFFNPHKWPHHKLVEVCDGKAGIKAGPFGSALKKDCYTAEGPRVYGQEQVIAREFSVGDYHISEDKFSEMSAYAVAPGDLLISLVGTIGRVLIVPNGIERGIINPRLLRVRPRLSILHPCYLEYFLTNPAIGRFFSDISNGITMGVLNAGLLKQLDIPLPPLALQKEFADRVTEIRALSRIQGAARHTLDDLFQFSMRRAFQGEL